MRANVRPILESIQKLYPKKLADSKWDNTGLLVDAISSSSHTANAGTSRYVSHKEAGNTEGGKHEAESGSVKPRVLLTVDLTSSVCDEAISQNADLIIAYHPFIFGGIKAISSTNPQHRSLMRLISAGISVYCPHTSVDASTKGNADWLADGITNYGKNEKKRYTVNPISPAIEGHESAGYGRVVELKEPIILDDLISRIKGHLWLSTIQLVKSPLHETEPIRSVAICAGSGGSVLKGCDADLWFTGELSHHEMLFLQESGVSAILCGHSNTERGFLPVLRDQLLNDLSASGLEALINIAQTDRDPIQYV